MIVHADDPISEIIGKLVTKRLNEVFVEQESRFGIVTLRNILRAGEVLDRKASTLTVTPPIVTPNDTVSKAAKIMSNLRIRSLPLVGQRGELLGSVSSHSLLRELSSSGSHGEPVSEIMTPSPVTLDFSDTIDKARSIMVERDFDHLPIIRNGKLAGLVTSLDLVTAIGSLDRAGRSSRLPEPSSKGSAELGGLVVNAPNTNRPREGSFDVLKSILDQDKTGSIIASDGKIQGIVTLRDFVRLLAVEPDLRGPPIYVVGLPENDLESSQAETRFRRSVEALGHVYHGLEEARAVVKTSSIEKTRRRYEIQVLIKAANEQFDFTEEGWSVADVFDKLVAKLKRLMTKPKDSPAHKRRLSRDEIETTKYS